MSELLGRLRRAWSRLVSGYWFIPGGIVVTASAVALGFLELDTRLLADGRSIGFTGGAESARALLSSIASSMLTLTALVFSVTVVVLQLASGQCSPSVLRGRTSSTLARRREVNSPTIHVIQRTPAPYGAEGETDAPTRFETAPATVPDTMEDDEWSTGRGGSPCSVASLWGSSLPL